MSATATTVDVSFSDVGFSIGDGARPFVSIANGTGSAQITATGFTGTFSGQATVDIPGVAFAGTVTVEIRETGPTATGDFVQVRLGSTGNPVTLSIAGQALTGVFTFEQLTTAAGDQVIRVGAIEVGLSIAGIVTLAGGTAAFVILPTGVAGRVSATGTVTMPAGITLQAGFAIAVTLNTTPTAVDEVFDFGEDPDVDLDVPAGPYLRVEITAADFTFSAGGFIVDASGNLTLERQSRVDGSTVTKIGFSDVEITIGAALGLGVEGQFSAGSGVFVALPTGIAGILTGTFSGAVGPVSAGGNVTIRVNTTGMAVEERVTVDGRELTVSFGPAEGDVFKVSVSGASLNIGDFVTIEGDVAIDSTTGTFAGTNLEVFLGLGPARLDDGSINPLATGVLLTDATIGLVRGTAAGTYAVFATGTLQLIGVAGVTVAGTATVRFNNTGSDVDRVLAIEGADRDVVVRVAAGIASFSALGLEISAFGQTLRGDFTFTKQGFGTPSTDPGIIVVTAANVTLDVGGVVRFTGGAGTLVITAAGLAASVSGTVAVTLPGVVFNGSFGVAVNTTGAAVGESGLTLPAGPYFRIESVGPVDLTVAGQTLRGAFSVERVNGATGAPLTRIAVSGVQLDLGLAAGPEITNGEGTFLVTAAGLAGELSADLALAGVATLSVTVAINTTAIAVNERFRVAGRDVVLELPAGPYLRAEANDVTLTIGGQMLTGDFVFERLVTLDGSEVVRVGLADVTLSLGDGALQLRNGQGSLLIGPTGIAGRFSVDLAVAIPNVALSGTLVVELNRTGVAVDETFVVGGSEQTLLLEAGTFLRVAGRGIALTIFGQTLGGDFVFESAGTRVSVAATNVALSLGGGVVTVTGGTALFVIAPNGFAGAFSGTVALAVPNVSVGVSVTVEVNATGQAVSETIGTETLTLAAGQYVRASGSGAIVVFGQTLSGSFSIEQATTSAGASVVKVAIAGVALSLGGGVVSITGASGGFVITPGGAAGSLRGTVTLGIPGFAAFTGTAEIQFNTQPAAVQQTFVVAPPGASPTTIELDLPAGRFVRISLEDAVLTLAGTVAITGDFVFQQQTAAGGSTVTIIGLADAALTVDGQGITGASGAFVIMPTGVAGVLAGRADVAAGPVSISGDLLVRVNKTGGAVDVTVEVGGRSIPIRFGADEGDVLAVSASNLSLNIGDFVTIEGDVAFTGDTFAGQNLEIFLGQGPARLENGDLNPLAVGVLLTNARVGLIRVGSTYALHAEGTVMLLGVNGVTIGGTAIVDVNTTGTIVQRTLDDPGQYGRAGGRQLPDVGPGDPVPSPRRRALRARPDAARQLRLRPRRGHGHDQRRRHRRRPRARRWRHRRPHRRRRRCRPHHPRRHRGQPHRPGAADRPRRDLRRPVPPGHQHHRGRRGHAADRRRGQRRPRPARRPVPARRRQRRPAGDRRPDADRQLRLRAGDQPRWRRRHGDRGHRRQPDHPGRGRADRHPDRRHRPVRGRQHRHRRPAQRHRRRDRPRRGGVDQRLVPRRGQHDQPPRRGVGHRRRPARDARPRSRRGATRRRDRRDDQRARPDDLGRCLVRARHDRRRRRHRRQRRRRDGRPRGRRQPRPVARWRTRHRQRRHGRLLRHERRRRPVHAGGPTERHDRRQHPRCSVRGRPSAWRSTPAPRRSTRRSSSAPRPSHCRCPAATTSRSPLATSSWRSPVSGSAAPSRSARAPPPTERGSCGSPSTTARSPSVGPRRSSRSQTSTATSS